MKGKFFRFIVQDVQREKLQKVLLSLSSPYLSSEEFLHSHKHDNKYKLKTFKSVHFRNKRGKHALSILTIITVCV